MLGAAPLVMFNIHSKGETFRGNTVWSAEEFTHKLRMAEGTLEGQGLFGYLVRDDNEGAPPRAARTALARGSERLSHAFDSPRRNLIPAALAGAFLLVPLLWRARTRAPRTILFALIVLLVAWPQMAFNRNTGGSVHHVVLLWPFPHLIVAVAFGEAAQKFGRAGKGPDLAKVGAKHPRDWIIEHIRNPRSHRSDSRMPPFEGKINDDDLRTLADYLASLK